jgi:acetyl-CoA synthetase
MVVAGMMAKLTEYTRFEDAQAHASPAALWELFDGDGEKLNIANECITRHADGSGRAAVRIAHADGRDEILSFDRIASGAAQFAHWLDAQGIEKGDRIAFMLEPGCLLCLPVRCDADRRDLRAVVHAVRPRCAQAARRRLPPEDPDHQRRKAEMARANEGVRVVVADKGLLNEIKQYPASYAPRTKAADMAVFQYTSGTTRELPEAVKHTHKTLVTLMFAALYGTGIRPGDEFFCPSSPAWGHGLWHGTLAPLAMGVTTGTFAGRFDATRLMKALRDHKITNMSAAATHYRMMKNAGTAGDFTFGIRKLSYTGEPIDPATLEFIDRTFRVPACSMYGTTEIGVVLVNYPGADDFQVKPGSLGKAVPGQKLQAQNPDGTPSAPGEIGELMLWRRDRWETTKDLAKVDADGYFYHCGRADDVIISAGWTMSAVEIENTMLKHPDVNECAVIGAPDATRGLVVKAFVVSPRAPSDAFVKELQDFTKERLAAHEFPRLVEFAAELPKTPAGKVHRKVLRDREAAKAAELTN